MSRTRSRRVCLAPRMRTCVKLCRKPQILSSTPSYRVDIGTTPPSPTSMTSTSSAPYGPWTVFSHFDIRGETGRLRLTPRTVTSSTPADESICGTTTFVDAAGSACRTRPPAGSPPRRHRPGQGHAHGALPSRRRPRVRPAPAAVAGVQHLAQTRRGRPWLIEASSRALHRRSRSRSRCSGRIGRGDQRLVPPEKQGVTFDAMSVSPV
jgi:hypothetical protein